MRVLSQILTWMFLAGLVGSVVVIAITFRQDIEAFSPDEGPRPITSNPDGAEKFGS
ncbi:MAG: hypothetical protein HYX26_02190 [Acidobacteriales bacterium]|nr:hypothetical protein [Terriglobales bacterium]